MEATFQNNPLVSEKETYYYIQAYLHYKKRANAYGGAEG